MSPTNFLTFNDAILKAAFLRAAHKSELLFSVDSECSENMCNVILAEISAWKTGNGDALPEFLISLASKRLRLEPRHTNPIKAQLSNASLPQYLARLGEEISVHDARGALQIVAENEVIDAMFFAVVSRFHSICDCVECLINFDREANH